MRRVSLGLVIGLLAFTRAAQAEESPAADTMASAPDDVARDAGDESAARDAFREGLRLLRQSDWHEAELKFRESLSLVPRKSAQYNLAFVLYMQHRRRECLAILDQLLRPGDEGAEPRYEQYGAVLKSRVQSELSTLRVLVTPATALVRIDGETPAARGPERWLVIEPGDHSVDISAPDYVPKHVVFATRAGTDVEREVALERVASLAPLPASARTNDAQPGAVSSAGRIAPWIVMGVGGALLVTATVTGVLAKDADDEFQSKCPSNKNCPQSLEGLRDRVVTLGRATDVLLVSGGVLVAGGLTWRLLLPAPKAAGEHASFVTVSGRF